MSSNLLFSALLAASSASATSTASAPAPAGRYVLIEEPGALYVTLKPKTSSLFGFLAHQHVVEAGRFSGLVEYDPAEPEACRIEIDVPVSGLVVDRPEMREKLGFEKDISDGDRKTVGEHMRKEDQLYAEAHDTIRFRGRSCAPYPGAEGFLQIVGDLEIRGTKHEIRVPAEVRFEGDELTVKSDFSELHETFGFEPYSAFAGSIQNARMIQFRVRVRAKRE